MHKIPQVIYLSVIFIIPFFGIAQRNAPNLPDYDTKRFHFGFSLGFNYANFTIKPQSNLNPFDSLLVVQPGGMAGFDIGIVSNMHLGRFFDLRFIPSLSLIERKVNYKLEYRKNTVGTETQDIESVNLNFPLLLKFKSSRMGNVRFYLISGAQYSIDLATRSKKRNNGNDIYLKLSASDLQAQIGVGIDFYLQYFKFAIEAKMSYGTLNLLKNENNILTNSVQSLRSKSFHLSFLFEG
ncbi:MAG: PorT family protein [Bacteroidales bacterium]|jgi:hypothetical protein|nr:PorT family protein [Bacteroidales bacterium]